MSQAGCTQVLLEHGVDYNAGSSLKRLFKQLLTQPSSHVRLNVVLQVLTCTFTATDNPCPQLLPEEASVILPDFLSAVWESNDSRLACVATLLESKASVSDPLLVQALNSSLGVPALELCFRYASVPVNTFRYIVRPGLKLERYDFLEYVIASCPSAPVIRLLLANGFTLQGKKFHNIRLLEDHNHAYKMYELYAQYDDNPREAFQWKKRANDFKVQLQSSIPKDAFQKVIEVGADAETVVLFIAAHMQQFLNSDIMSVVASFLASA